MSKYKKALEAFTHIGLCDACGSQNLKKLCEDIIEALEIADRLEQVDVEEAKNIYCQELACAGLCDECDHLEDFADGYNQALADIRGDAE